MQYSWLVKYSLPDGVAAAAGRRRASGSAATCTAIYYIKIFFIYIYIKIFFYKKYSLLQLVAGALPGPPQRARLLEEDALGPRAARRQPAVHFAGDRRAGHHGVPPF